MKKRLIVSLVVVLLVVGSLLTVKYIYSAFVDIAINKSFEALKPELDKMLEQNKDAIANELSKNKPDNANNDDSAAERNTNENSNIDNNSLNERENNTPQNNAISNNKASNQIKSNNKQDIASIVDEKDKKRAMQIVTSVVSADDIPRLVKLYNSGTADAKRELKSVYNRFTSSQKRELLNLYNKYKKYIK